MISCTVDDCVDIQRQFYVREYTLKLYTSLFYSCLENTDHGAMCGTYFLF